MITLTADEALLATLQQATGLAEIRDASGKIVGFFAPVGVDRAHLYAQAAAQIDPPRRVRCADHPDAGP